MYNCVWSIEIIYGKQKEALEIIRAWGAEKMRSSHFKVAANRVLTGYVGESPSHIFDEYVFPSLADFERALEDMKQEKFKTFSDSLAPFIVPASQKWTIYKIVSQINRI